MADKLTQLQDCLDQLATQMYASLYYVSNRTALARIPGQPYHGIESASSVTGASQMVASPAAASPPAANSTPNNVSNQHESGVPESQQQQGEDIQRPDSPNTFSAALQELSRDLVLKEQQIEQIIRSLPGMTSTQEQQEARLKELDEEMKLAERELAEAAKVKEVLLERVEGAIMRCKRW